MDRKEAIKALEYELSCVDAESPRGELAEPALIMAIEALSAEPTVIRSKTLMTAKDFKEWAKRVREENPNAIIIPCDAEVVSAELTLQTPQTYGKSVNPSNAEVVADLISRADAIDAVRNICNTPCNEYFVNALKALPSADRPSGEWEYSEDFEDDVVYTCTNCGEPWVLIDGTPQENNMNYCPNCGAKMEGHND